MPNVYIRDPYQDMMAAPVASPDVASAAETLTRAGVAMAEIEDRNQQRQVERNKLQLEETRLASESLLKTQELVDRRRQQDFENTARMIDMAAKAKRDDMELRGRQLQIDTAELAFNEQVSRVASRNAMAKFQPLLQAALFDENPVAFSEYMHQVIRVPGIGADPEVQAQLGEYGKFMQMYQVDTPQGTKTLSQITAAAEAGDLEAFKAYAKVSKRAPADFLNDPQIQSRFGAVFAKAKGQAPLESYISYQAEAVPLAVSQVSKDAEVEREKEYRAMLVTAAPGERAKLREQHEFDKQMRKLEDADFNFQAPVPGEATADSRVRSYLRDQAQRSIGEVLTGQQRLQERAKRRAALLRDQDVTDLPKDPKRLAEVRAILRDDTTAKPVGGIDWLFQESKSRLKQIDRYNTMLETALTGLQDPGTLDNPDAIDQYISMATEATTGLNPIYRALGVAPLTLAGNPDDPDAPAGVFNRPAWQYIRHRRQLALDRRAAAMPAPATIPSTAVPSSEIPFKQQK